MFQNSNLQDDSVGPWEENIRNAVYIFVPDYFAICIMYMFYHLYCTIIYIYKFIHVAILGAAFYCQEWDGSDR